MRLNKGGIARGATRDGGVETAILRELQLSGVNWALREKIHVSHNLYPNKEAAEGGNL